MKVETQELPESQVALSFEVEPVRLEQALDAASRRAAGRVNIPGFRRGKAPRAIVERVVGRESLLQDALDDLLPKVYREAVEEARIRPLTPPEFEVQSVEPLRATATVVVPPVVALGDYRGIQLEPADPAVTAEQVDSVLDQLREQHAQWVPGDRPAEFGDRATLDVSGVCDDRVVLNRDDVEYLLEKDSLSPLPGFVDGVVGIAVDEERAFDVQVPDDAEYGDLAGKQVAFRVTGKDVKIKELPELDDAFASMVGPHTDVAELRAHCEEQLLEEAEESARRAALVKVVEEAVSCSPVELPSKLVEQEAQRIDDRLANRLGMLRITKEQYNRMVGRTEEQAQEELRRLAEADLRRSLVLLAIADQEGVEVPEETIDVTIRAAVSDEGRSGGSVASMLKDPDVRDRVRASLREDRATAWLFEHATGEALPNSEGGQLAAARGGPLPSAGSVESAPQGEEQATAPDQRLEAGTARPVAGGEGKAQP